MRTPQSFYERRVFPWFNDKLTGSPDLVRLRTEVLASSKGCGVSRISSGEMNTAVCLEAAG